MSKYNKVHKKHSFLNFFIKIVGAFIIATMSIALYDIYMNINVDYTETTDNKTEAQTKEEIEDNIYSTIENVSTTVVGISKLQSVDSSFFSLNAVETYNLGTGVIIAKEGYVLTNYHVSGNILEKCYIKTEKGEEYTAKVVWADENLDLSILKINTTREMEYANLGDSDSLRVGQEVYAIGNPLGAEFQRTVTKGIISALDRTIKIEKDNQMAYMEELIQTDASINSGNSGGPLIDIEGKVIGITSIKIAEAEGIGFAVPVNIVKPIIDSLRETGKFEETSLGVLVYDKEAIQYLDSSLELEYGIYVEQVISGGAAEKAKIRKGDIIEKIDGLELNRINDLRKYIYSKKVGEEITLTILRNKEEMEVKLKLLKK